VRESFLRHESDKVQIGNLSRSREPNYIIIVVYRVPGIANLILGDMARYLGDNVPDRVE